MAFSLKWGSCWWLFWPGLAVALGGKDNINTGGKGGDRWGKLPGGAAGRNWTRFRRGIWLPVSML